MFLSKVPIGSKTIKDRNKNKHTKYWVNDHTFTAFLNNTLKIEVTSLIPRP